MSLVNYSLPFGGIGTPTWATLSPLQSHQATAVNNLLYGPAGHQETDSISSQTGQTPDQYYKNNPYAPPPSHQSTQYRTRNNNNRNNNNYLPPPPPLPSVSTPSPQIQNQYTQSDQQQTISRQYIPQTTQHISSKPYPQSQTTRNNYGDVTYTTQFQNNQRPQPTQPPPPSSQQQQQIIPNINQDRSQQNYYNTFNTQSYLSPASAQQDTLDPSLDQHNANVGEDDDLNYNDPTNYGIKNRDGSMNSNSANIAPSSSLTSRGSKTNAGGGGVGGSVLLSNVNFNTGGLEGVVNNVGIIGRGSGVGRGVDLSGDGSDGLGNARDVSVLSTNNNNKHINNNNNQNSNIDPYPIRPPGFTKVNAGQGGRTQVHAILDYDADEDDEHSDEYYDDEDIGQRNESQGGSMLYTYIHIFKSFIKNILQSRI